MQIAYLFTLINENIYSTLGLKELGVIKELVSYIYTLTRCSSDSRLKSNPPAVSTMAGETDTGGYFWMIIKITVLYLKSINQSVELRPFNAKTFA